MTRPLTILSIFLLIFTTGTLLDSCTKTNSNPSPPTVSTSPPVRSLLITFPANQAPDALFRQMTYSFSTDTAHNSVSMQILDSMSVPNSIYSLYNTTKTYTYSSTVPRRVIKISFRQSQTDQYGAPTPNINYDILFDYDDYTDIPHNISVISYSDLAGTVVKDQYLNTVLKYAKDYYLTGTFDYMTGIINTTPAMPLRTLTWTGQRGGFWYDAYTDTSFEVREDDPHYYETLFNTPDFSVPNPYFQYQYTFDATGQCRGFVIDMMATTYNPSYNLFYGQRKMDFTYDNSSADLHNIIDLLCSPKTLYWEKLAQQSTDLIMLDGWQEYAYLDLYMPDIHSYYANTCSSYTDSIFTVDNGHTRRFLYKDTFVNKIEKDSNGNIISISKSDELYGVLRNIKVGY